MRKGVTVLVVAFLLVSLIPGPAIAAEDPRFEVEMPEPELQPGQVQTVSVQLINDAKDVDERVETAHNVKVTPKAGSTPLTVVSGPQLVGTMQDGQPHLVDFRVEVPADTPGGTYRLPLTVTYEFDGDERERVTVYATVRVPERPIFAVETVDTDLFAGETGTVSVAMTNTGSVAANGTTVEVSSPNPALSMDGAQSTTKFLGQLESGETREFTIPVTATSSAVSMEYAVQVRPTYRDENDVTVRAPSTQIGVQPAEGDRFAVVDVNEQIIPGETGSLQITLRNRGETAVSDATVRLESATPAITFDGQPAATEFVGAWEPGETRTVTADVSAVETVDDRHHAVQTSVTFAHQTGIQSQSGPFEIGVMVSPQQAFEYSGVSVDLQGSNGVLTGTITNPTDRPVHNAVVSLGTESPRVTVVEPTQPVGTLSPGESASLAFDLHVSPAANPGVRQFDATVRYDRGESETYRSDATPLRAHLATEEQLFELEPVNATFGIDTENTFTVRIRNTGDEPLSDIRARLAAIPPYQSQSPSAYVDSLEPGESAILTFEVTTPEDAVPTRDALPVNVTAETTGDETVRPGPYIVPFTIAEAEGTTSNSTIIAAGAVVVIVFLAGSWWWLNR